MRYLFALCALVMIMPIDATTIQPIALPAAYRGTGGGLALMEETFPSTSLPSTLLLRKGATAYTNGEDMTEFFVYTPMDTFNYTRHQCSNLYNVTPNSHKLVSLVRSGNVVTATFSEPHGMVAGAGGAGDDDDEGSRLTVENTALPAGATTAFNGTWTAGNNPQFRVSVVVSATVLQYPQTGEDATAVLLRDDRGRIKSTIRTTNYIGEGVARLYRADWARCISYTAIPYTDAVARVEGVSSTGWANYTYTSLGVSCRKTEAVGDTVVYTVTGTRLALQSFGLTNSGRVKVQIKQGATEIAAARYAIPYDNIAGGYVLDMYELFNGTAGSLVNTATLASGLTSAAYTITLTLLGPTDHVETIYEPDRTYTGSRFYDYGVIGYNDAVAGTVGTHAFVDEPSANRKLVGTGNQEYAGYWAEDAADTSIARTGTHGYEKLVSIAITDATGSAISSPATWAAGVEGTEWTSSRFTVTQVCTLYFDDRTTPFATVTYTQVFTPSGYSCTVSRVLTAAAYRTTEYPGMLNVPNRATTLNVNTDIAAGGGFDNWLIDNQASYDLPHTFDSGSTGAMITLAKASGAVAWNDEFAVSSYITDWDTLDSNTENLDALLWARTDKSGKFYQRLLTGGQACVVGDVLTYTIAIRCYKLTNEAATVLLDLDALLLSPVTADERAVLRSDVYLRLMMPEAGNDRLPAATVDNALAKAYRQFALDTRCFTRDVRLPVVDGALRYQLPADVIEPNGDYVLLNSRPLQELSASDLMYASSTWATDTTASLPFTFYRDRTGAFHLYPTPVGLTATATLTIACDIIPSTLIDAGCIPLMSATQGPLINAAYTDALPAYAAWWLATYALKDDEFPASIAQDALADYKELVSACIGANRGYLV